MLNRIKEAKKNNELWLEKSNIIHKHDFTIDCLFEVRLVGKRKIGLNYQVNLYEVKKCKYCHSFYYNNFLGIYFNHNEEDNFLNNIDVHQRNMPHIIGFKEDALIDFINFNKICFEDGFVWKKSKV